MDLEMGASNKRSKLGLRENIQKCTEFTRIPSTNVNYCVHYDSLQGFDRTWNISDVDNKCDKAHFLFSTSTCTAFGAVTLHGLCVTSNRWPCPSWRVSINPWTARACPANTFCASGTIEFCFGNQLQSTHAPIPSLAH